MSRMSRFELVHSDAGWFARFIAANGREVWRTSETYKKRGGAIKGINVIAGVVGAPQHVIKTHGWGVRDVGYGIEIDFGSRGLLEVREVDERYVPPPVVLEPPFYVGEWTEFQGKGRATKAVILPFWHDRDYHWRFCADPCEEGTPPDGAEVRSRMGTARYSA